MGVRDCMGWGILREGGLGGCWGKVGRDGFCGGGRAGVGSKFL